MNFVTIDTGSHVELEKKMSQRYSRRGFLKHSAAVFGAAAAGSSLSFLPLLRAPQPPDIIAAKGDTPRKLLARALDLLGGMKSFVRRGDKVVLLPNPQGKFPGVSTNPELVAAVVEQCFNAGASEVTIASIHSEGRWLSSGLVDAAVKAGAKMHSPQSRNEWVEMTIQKGKKLKKVTIVRKAVENDTLINIPIFKQHDSSRITCCLKNLMGFNAANTSFHQGDEHLHQCIADLASCFSSKLSVVDALQILSENGPFGPGKILSPKQVVVGTDPVAIDAYCCRFLNLKPTDVDHIIFAQSASLGRIDLSQLTIKEIEI
jgi:uncharacterized protein (DUF362 family)